MLRTRLTQCYGVTVEAMRVCKRRSRALQDTSMVEMDRVIRDCGLKSLYLSVLFTHVPRGNKSRPPYPRHTTWHRVMCIVHQSALLPPAMHEMSTRPAYDPRTRSGYQQSYMRKSEHRAVLWCQPPSSTYLALINSPMSLQERSVGPNEDFAPVRLRSGYKTGSGYDGVLTQPRRMTH